MGCCCCFYLLQSIQKIYKVSCKSLSQIFRASPFFRTQDALLPHMLGSLLRSWFHTHRRLKWNIKHLCQHSMCKFSGSDDLYSAIKFAFLFPVYVFGSCFRMLVVILVYFIYFIFSLSHIFTTFRRWLTKQTTHWLENCCECFSVYSLSTAPVVFLCLGSLFNPFSAKEFVLQDQVSDENLCQNKV